MSSEFSFLVKCLLIVSTATNSSPEPGGLILNHVLSPAFVENGTISACVCVCVDRKAQMKLTLVIASPV